MISQSYKDQPELKYIYSIQFFLFVILTANLEMCILKKQTDKGKSSHPVNDCGNERVTRGPS